MISQILDDIAPELAATEAELKTRIINYASMQLSSRKLGDKYDYCVALLAAHILTLKDRQGKGGTISNAGEGSLSLGFAVLGSQKSAWSATSYGVELSSLIRRTILAVGTSYGR